MKYAKWIISFAFLMPMMALALPSGVPVVMSSGVPIIMPSPLLVNAEVGFGQLAQMLLSAIGDFKSGGWLAGAVALIYLIIGTMKNSAIRGMLWDKLGAAKVLVAPILSFIMVEIVALSSGQGFTFKSIMLSLVTGAGAIALYEIMAAVKSIPGIGPVWVSVIDFIGKILQKPQAQPVVSK